MPIRQVKREIRILGVDDARFERGRDEWTRLVGVVHRSEGWIEGCLQAPIRVDGDDATAQLTNMVQMSSHYGQLRVIMTRDTIFGGVNVLNLPMLSESIDLPVIAISDSEPDMEKVTAALQRFSPKDWKEKRKILIRCGPVREVESRLGKSPVYVQWAGLPFNQVREIIQNTTSYSRIPEPIRVAHLIATSFVPNP